MDLDIKGLRVLVTAGAGGIGKVMGDAGDYDGSLATGEREHIAHVGLNLDD